jgi:ComF family protein
MRHYSQMISQLTQRCYNALLPPVCLLCGQFTQQYHSICTDCQQNLPRFPPACARCALFLPISTPSPVLCGNCLPDPPPYRVIYSLFPYEPPIERLIIELKFHQRLSHAAALGQLLATKIRTDWYANAHLPDLIIPIPLHAQRLRSRGYNQALEIARPLSKLLHIPIDISGTTRHKPTQPQSELKARARKDNIAHAFTVTRHYTGLTLAIVDDVVTTGHTVREFCRTLKQQGAKQIDVWCCARRG